jgi:DNA repair protein RadA/Sms
LKEAQKLGFARAILPEGARSESTEAGLVLMPVGMLVNLVSEIAARGDTSRRGARDRDVAAE